MEQLINLTTLLTIIGVLVALVNIVTQVMKNVLPEKLPTSLLAIVLSLVLTIVAFVAYCQYAAIVIVWYYIVGAIVVGFMVAYAAMFGFDKLKEILQGLGIK
jgi:divalent metal cation (Fe/Co/Zn/Cd) transporter